MEDFLLVYFNLGLYVSVCLSVCHFNSKPDPKHNCTEVPSTRTLSHFSMGVTFLTCKLRKSSNNHSKPTSPMTSFFSLFTNLTITRTAAAFTLFSITVNGSFSVLFLQLLNGCIVHSVIRVVHTGNLQILKCNRYIVKYYRCILHICMSSRIKAFYLDAF